MPGKHRAVQRPAGPEASCERPSSTPRRRATMPPPARLAGRRGRSHLRPDRCAASRGIHGGRGRDRGAPRRSVSHGVRGVWSGFWRSWRESVRCWSPTRWTRLIGAPGQHPLPADLEPVVEGCSNLVGYVGAMGWWIDFELLRAAAEARPSWRFVLVGPVLCEETFADIASLPPQRPPPGPQGPRRAAGLRRQLYRRSDSVSPGRGDASRRPGQALRVRRHGSADRQHGYPTMSARRPVHIARSSEEFIACLDRAVEERTDPEARRALRQFALENTWDATEPTRSCGRWGSPNATPSGHARTAGGRAGCLRLAHPAARVAKAARAAVMGAGQDRQADAAPVRPTRGYASAPGVPAGLVCGARSSRSASRSSCFRRPRSPGGICSSGRSRWRGRWRSSGCRWSMRRTPISPVCPIGGSGARSGWPTVRRCSPMAATARRSPGWECRLVCWQYWPHQSGFGVGCRRAAC